MEGAKLSARKLLQGATCVRFFPPPNGPPRYIFFFIFRPDARDCIDRTDAAPTWANATAGAVDLRFPDRVDSRGKQTLALAYLVTQSQTEDLVAKLNRPGSGGVWF